MTKRLKMIIKKHGITSWSGLLHSLTINENHLKASDFHKLEKWCQKHIRSNFRSDNLKPIKDIVKSYLILNAQNTPTTLIEPDIGLNIVQKAAKLDFDAFLSEMLSQHTEDETKVILASKTTQGNTALHYAGLYGNENSLKVLLEYGATPNVTNTANRSPIYLSALGLHNDLKKHSNCVRLLLRGTESNYLLTENNIGMSFLLPLMRFGDVDLIKEALNKNPELLLAKDERNQNLLHLALINNNEPLVEFFLGFDQLIIQKTLNDSTALHLACRYASEAIISRLLKHPLCNNSEFLNSIDEHGNTSLEYLNERGKNNLIAEFWGDSNEYRFRALT